MKTNNRIYNMKDGEQESCTNSFLSPYPVPCTLNPSGGFTILYAVLVGSLALSLGLSIFNITIKQLALSSSGRESQIAFYAADSGVECAFYSDFISGAFPVTNPEDPPVPLGAVTCDYDTNMPAPTVEMITTSDPVSVVSTFTLYLNPGPACAIIKVTKTPDTNDDGYDQTALESRGQNDCADTNNPRRVERAIRVRY